MQTCSQCQKMVEEWNEKCGSCGFRLVLEPDEVRRRRYLRRPSLGAVLFTQGWALGARLYIWFLISLVPIAGLVVLFSLLVFGRRWSWKYGSWESWNEFTRRMKLLDVVSIIWLVLILGVSFWLRQD